MNTSSLRTLTTTGGICGIVGTIFYILAVAVPMPERIAFTLAVTWPVLSIVFAYSLYRVIASNGDGMMNQLALLFAIVGFAMVAMMISVQLAVRMGIAEYMGSTIPGEENLHGIIRQALRLVDMGIDVAWDIFIGSSLICLSVALVSHPRFGRAWGIPSALFGAGLIGLNIVTFPWPPNTRGLFDLGPFIGLFIILLSTRLLLLRGTDR